MNTILNKFIISTFCCFIFLNLQAQLSVSSSKTNALYDTGEIMSFRISGETAGTVEWKLKYDNFAPHIAVGSFDLEPGETYEIFFQEENPSVVLCEAELNGEKVVASAAFAPFDIEPLEDEPNDFDVFWEAQKKLAHEFPLNPQIEMYEDTENTTTYLLRLDNMDERFVYSYITIPKTTGPFPALLVFPAYGSAPNLTQPESLIAERGGVIAVSIGIHNVPPYEIDPNAYQPNDYTDRTKNYYRYALLGAVRVIDYLETMIEYDGENLGVTGVSQGGGLSILLSGLDERIRLLSYSNPILSQNSGLYYNQAGGFPNYVYSSRTQDGTAAHEAATVDAMNYYDAMFFAKRYNGPIYSFISYEDQVTPAATSFASFNQFPDKDSKILMHALDLNHNHPSEYWQGRIEFIHRHFPSSLETTLFPFNQELGYFINAGRDSIIQEGDTALLEALIQHNDTLNPNYQLEWSVYDGPCTVDFDTPNAYQTQAVFNKKGQYILQFKATDLYKINEERKYYTLMDYVTINVEGENCEGVDECTPCGIISSTDTPTQATTLMKLMPNPTNDLTHLQYYLPQSAKVDLTIVNSNGQLVQKIQKSTAQAAGWQQQSISTQDLNTGSYFIQLTTSHFTQVIKLMIVR